MVPMHMKRHLLAAWFAASVIPALAGTQFVSLDASVQRIDIGSTSVYVFTNTAATVTLAPAIPLNVVRALVVGGGGAGGWTIGGGGGGGGVIDFTPAAGANVPLLPGTDYTLSVGAGGYDQSSPQTEWPDGGDGENSTLDLGTTNLVAFGGGGGAGWHGVSGTSAGHDGGCGGGSCNRRERGTAAEYQAVGLQGGSGGASLAAGGTDSCPGGGGGGGGNGADGQSGHAGNGGIGYLCDITGVATYYAGGGGGGAGNDCNTAGSGGLGGGGDGSAINSNLPGTPGADGLGGGGGGGSYNGPTHGGAGGSGVVILAVTPATDAPVLSASAAATGLSTATLSASPVFAGLDASTVDFSYRVWIDGQAAPAFAKGATGVATGSTWSQNLTNLIADVLYRFEVTATNDLGVAADENVAGTFRTWVVPVAESAFSTSDASVRRLETSQGATYVFTNTAGTLTFTPLTDLVLEQALVVGGGGGGGWTIGGGGGGGGVIDFAPESGLRLLANQTYSIVVGAGGSNQANVGNWPNGLNGGDSSLDLLSTNLVALGGGGGGSWNSSAGLAGGCGGGSSNRNATEAEGGQGGNGGPSVGECPGGGGGAGGNGQPGQNAAQTAGQGGIGYLSDITGTPAYYAGGGGGGGGNSCHYGGQGGLGGGGDGRDANSPVPAGAGTDGLGGGGAGGSHASANCGGRGGSGTVILALRYPDSITPTATFEAATLSTSSVSVTGTLASPGTGALSADLYFTCGPNTNNLPAATLARSGWTAGTSWSTNLCNLPPGKPVYFQATLVNDLGEESTFTGSARPALGVSTDPGATVIIDGDRIVYVFDNPSAGSVTFTPAAAVSFDRALLVGGGGAGGWTIGGGGGGGGVVSFTPAEELLLAANEPISLSVGAGGDNMPAYGWTYGRNGGNSTLAFGNVSLAAIGGGGGGSWSERNQGGDGGCGGGSANNGNARAAGSQGGNGGINNGDKPGGGGGAGGNGQDGNTVADTAGKGGDGILSDITGTPAYYAGGGGGAGGNSCLYGAPGGLGGGGRGYDKDSNRTGQDGADGLGGGGGGGAYGGGCPGGRGGNGTVILAFSLLSGTHPIASVTPLVSSPGSVSFTGLLAIPGDGADTAEATLSYAPVGQQLPAGTVVKTGWTENESFTVSYSGLTPGIPYAYVVGVTNNIGNGIVLEGTFSTAEALGAYVAETGNDTTGNGTQANPFRTVTRAFACTAAGATIHVAPGTYDVEAGERFPLDATGYAILGSGDIGEYAILDGGNASENLFTVTNGSFALSNLWLRETTNAIFWTRNATLDVADCRFTQSFENYLNSNTSEDGITLADVGVGVLESRITTDATFDRCDFVGMKRFSIFESLYHCMTVTLNDSLVASNNVINGVFSSACWGNVAAMRLFFNRTDFIENVGDYGYRHDCANCSIAYVCGNSANGPAEIRSMIAIDACRFLANRGGNLVGLDYCSPNLSTIRNSLFVDNYAHQAMFQGHDAEMRTYNSTFIRNSGNYSAFNMPHTLYDCVISDGGPMGFWMPNYGDRSNAGATRLENCLLWNTPDGTGWNRVGSTLVEADPILENAGAAWSDPAFDASPRPYSPAIDAGVNGRIDSTGDLAGNPRIADNDGDGTPVIDLGAYESPYGDSDTPAFLMPFPGVTNAIRGTTVDIPITISPAAEGPVTASVAYPDDATGPATLVFADGTGPVILPVTFPVEGTGSWTRVVVSDAADPAGVLPLNVDAYLSGFLVNAGHNSLVYVREGETITLPVRLDLDGVVAPAAIPVELVSTAGAGSNTLSWNGGAGIAKGAASTVGGLVLAGHAGVNTATLRAGAGYSFAETESDTFTITVVGYPGWMAVDPSTGDDDQYVGSMASPFRTVTRALEVLRDGDTVRLLPGTYTAATQTFPWNPGNVALVGYDANGPADPADVVIDGGGTVATLVCIGNLDGSATNAILENLTLRDTASAAVQVDWNTVSIRNCAFTQAAENADAYGAILMRDNARATAERCSFTGIRRHAVVAMAQHLIEDDFAFTARQCVFADNASGLAAIAGYSRGKAWLYDCDFLGNTVLPNDCQRYQGSEVFRSPVAVIRQGTLDVERCRFLGNSGGPVFCTTYFWAHVYDSLFAGNDATLGIVEGVPAVTGIFHGYGAYMQFFNCTLAGNSGGYNGCNCEPYFYNSILADDGPFSVMPYGGWMDKRPIRLYNVIAYDMAEGVTGFNTNESSNVWFDDPKFRNVSVPWNHPAFDARLKGDSPARDAGRNDLVQPVQRTDLCGDARVAYGTPANAKAAGDPVVDLGCYECPPVYAGTILIVR
jgi:hypothetical protein